MIWNCKHGNLDPDPIRGEPIIMNLKNENTLPIIEGQKQKSLDVALPADQPRAGGISALSRTISTMLAPEPGIPSRQFAEKLI